eukprot:g77440.t1
MLPSLKLVPMWAANEITYQEQSKGTGGVEGTTGFTWTRNERWVDVSNQGGSSCPQGTKYCSGKNMSSLTCRI